MNDRSTGRCDHPRIMMLMLFATIGLNVYLYIAIPKGFFPQQDTGQLQGGIRGDAQSSFQLMKRKLQEVAAIIQADPAVNTVTGSVGGGGFGPAAAAARAPTSPSRSSRSRSAGSRRTRSSRACGRS